ncbi:MULTISPECIES: S26 family signal peptidase [Halobacterium]|uniref:S26 family signal peptidase n=1 Tax=Halobacterium TaxID=2239 RepID=UPI001965E460|nr:MULTISPECIES: S26 family signal peptidase [Halobacterium]MDL0122754.1 S26 family signal peptidase [Halobacterium salinarum]QRY22565.1 S26 family signal peptidase [Halobacterium sp. GSL-19]QRY24630.1 S26 family signal peptidase [Halobacterium sp. BOL4-2]
MTGDDVPDPTDGPRAAVRWFWSTDRADVLFVREALSSLLVVSMVGLLLFSVSGVWPPLVAVESGSMQPNLQKGDLVFVTEEHRLSPEYASGETGVVPHRTATAHGYEKIGGTGDVIVYEPDGNSRAVPIIHRARFWVDNEENWYDRADESIVAADSCSELRNCPAPHAGFITKGDNNRSNNYYDQSAGLSEPVKPGWVRGTAEYRVPFAGWVRLVISGEATVERPGGAALGGERALGQA